MSKQRIALTRAQASAIRADLAEINQAQAIVQVRARANKRLTDMIVADAGLNPDDFSSYRLTDGEEVYIELTLAQAAPSEE